MKVSPGHSWLFCYSQWRRSRIQHSPVQNSQTCVGDTSEVSSSSQKPAVSPAVRYARISSVSGCSLRTGHCPQREAMRPEGVLGFRGWYPCLLFPSSGFLLLQGQPQGQVQRRLRSPRPTIVSSDVSLDMKV